MHMFEVNSFFRLFFVVGIFQLLYGSKCPKFSKTTNSPWFSPRHLDGDCSDKYNDDDDDDDEGDEKENDDKDNDNQS